MSDRRYFKRMARIVATSFETGPVERVFLRRVLAFFSCLAHLSEVESCSFPQQHSSEHTEGQHCMVVAASN
jgi:hypothetical protein